MNLEESKQRQEILEEFDIFPLVVHTAYLINLAAVKEEFYHNSRQLLRETGQRAYYLGAPYVVMHIGSHGGKGFKEGLELFIATLKEEMYSWPSEIELLLENTAGGGTSLGGTFISVGNILKAVGEDFPLGMCFDTAHAWAAGYDIASPGGVKRTMKELEEHVGLDKVKVLHVNDTNSPRGSHRDRHSHLGEGLIGEAGFRMLFDYEWPAAVAAILETPQMGSEWDSVNLERLSSYAEGSQTGSHGLG